MIQTFNAIIDMDLPSNEKALLLTILRHVNHTTGECFPSVETLMRKSGIKSKSTFLKVRKNLVEKGLLQYNQRGTKLYYLITLEPVQNLHETSTKFDLNQSNSRLQTEYKQKNKQNKLITNSTTGTNSDLLNYIMSEDNPDYDYLHNFGWMYSELSSEFIC